MSTWLKVPVFCTRIGGYLSFRRRIHTKVVELTKSKVGLVILLSVEERIVEKATRICGSKACSPNASCYARKMAIYTMND